MNYLIYVPLALFGIAILLGMFSLIYEKMKELCKNISSMKEMYTNIYNRHYKKDCEKD